MSKETVYSTAFLIRITCFVILSILCAAYPSYPLNKGLVNIITQR